MTSFDTNKGRGWDVLKAISSRLYRISTSQSGSTTQNLPTGNLKNELLVAAGDALSLILQAIYTISSKMGYKASLVPKPFTNQAGRAAHVHRSAVSPFAEDTEKAGYFLAGLLYNLPSLCLLTMPTVNSYARMQEKCWAGVYQCFGFENREAPLRLICKGRGLVNVDRMELKAVDGTSNPYLSLAGMLVARMDGLNRGLKLPRPVQVDPADLPDSKRPNWLPKSLTESVKAFVSNSLWPKEFGSSFVELFTRLRRAVLNHCQGIGNLSDILDLLKTRS